MLPACFRYQPETNKTKPSLGIRDIVVTTPQRAIDTAAEEAKRCIDSRKGFYFRTFFFKPRFLDIGSRIYYIEHPFVRGFGEVSEIREGNMRCEVTGTDWGDGYHAIMPAKSWHWIKPISMKGFQGWRYFDVPRKKIIITGGWLMPKPAV
jgi:hypothetical protein